MTTDLRIGDLRIDLRRPGRFPHNDVRGLVITYNTQARARHNEFMPLGSADRAHRQAIPPMRGTR